jgi:D-alanyl-lipoteichoic acid acyltransferase DltB (MBOAT superfamily)
MMRADVSRERPTLTDYINLRLGSTARAQAVNFLLRPFTAETFAGFWRYWNPVFSYYLSYYCYQPLRRWLPRAPAVVATFAACGALHAAIAFLLAGMGTRPALALFAILWFTLLGVSVVLLELLRLSFVRWPPALRPVAHVGIIAVCYKAAELLNSAVETL